LGNRLKSKKQKTKNRNMENLIKIDRNESGEAVVSARELHAFLESRQDFSNWVKNRIEKYGFIENQDFEVFNKVVGNPQGGRPLIEYALTLDMAKELSMVEGNEKGKLARQYFITCEKKLKEVALDFSNPDTVLKLAQNWADERKRRMEMEALATEQQKQLTEQKPKVDYYDLVLQSDGTYSTGLIAKDLGTSATTLNKALHYLRVQYRQGSTWVLYAEHQGKGYTKLRTGLYADGAGRQRASSHMVWTEAGRAFVMGLFGNGRPSAEQVVREHELNGRKQNIYGYEETFGAPGERAGQGAVAAIDAGHGDGAW